jgi:hypothetical protein
MKPVTPLIMTVLIALVLAACGGSDSDSDGESPTTSAQGDDQPDTTLDGTDSGNDQTTAPGTDIGDHFDTAGGTATVTIGDETWEFVLVEDLPVVLCDADFFGGFVAILANEGADLSKGADMFAVTLPGGDFTDPPTASVNLGATSGAEWIADETVYEQYADLPAGLGVTSFSIDGLTASGTAVFFEQESVYQFNAGNGDLQVADGTFTVSCVSDE